MMRKQPKQIKKVESDVGWGEVLFYIIWLGKSSLQRWHLSRDLNEMRIEAGWRSECRTFLAEGINAKTMRQKRPGLLGRSQKGQCGQSSMHWADSRGRGGGDGAELGDAGPAGQGTKTILFRQWWRLWKLFKREETQYALFLEKTSTYKWPTGIWINAQHH